MLAILTTHPIQYQVPLWKELAKQGGVPFEVWFLSDHATRPSFDTEFKQTFSWDLDMLDGYPHRFLKTNRNHDVSRFSRLRLEEPLRKLLREEKVDALWIQGWQVAAYWQAAWQASGIHVPVWLRGESNDLGSTAGWKKPIKAAALGRLFSKVSEFLYIGTANRRLYEKFGVREKHLHPAYYCVDNERFRKEAADLRPTRAEIRRAWGIPEDRFCVLFAGKFIPKKRPMDLVEAVKQLPLSRDQKPHLLFVGSGELSQVLRSACNVVYDAESGHSSESESECTDNQRPEASFTGFLNQTEISKAYVAADCLVLPSDPTETWGLVVNEAMSSGLPCIASDACGCTEDLIAPIDRHLSFKLGNVSSIAAAIQSVMSNPPSQEVLRKQVERFSLKETVTSVRALYASVPT
jgi:glycosyltransferase involved in cell wall biosynthesis